MQPIKLKPAFADYLWGGSRLVHEYNKVTDLRPLGETWEFSVHPDGPSTAADGEFQGKTLKEIFELHPEYLGKAESFPVLIKFIDAQDDLSLQVHPADEYAYKHENQAGKNELWYVLDALPGSTIIVGFKKPMTQKEIADAIENNTILDYINKIPVTKGDCFEIPAGLIHGIGAGVLVAEVQQNSNVTYRVYDYDRKDSCGNTRQLHIKQALDVIDSKLKPVNRREGKAIAKDGYTLLKLTDWEWFTTWLLDIASGYKTVAPQDTFQALMVISGEGTLSSAGYSAALKKGDSLLIPAGMGEYSISGQLELIVTTLS